MQGTLTISKPNSEVKRNLDEVTLDRIRALDITAILDAHGVKRRGRAVFCPFHKNERTPAASIHNNRLHCFGCVKSWDSIALYRAWHGLSFRDAVEAIASDYGIVLPSADDPGARERATRWQRSKREAERIASKRDDDIGRLNAKLWRNLSWEQRACRLIQHRSASGAWRENLIDLAFTASRRALEYERQIEALRGASAADLVAVYGKRGAA